MEDFAFARLRSHQIPEMADLCLPNAMNAAKTLLQAIGIPRKIIIDHQVSALQIDPLTSSISGDQNQRLPVLGEGFLRPGSLLTSHAAMNGHHCIVTAQQCAD